LREEIHKYKKHDDVETVYFDAERVEKLRSLRPKLIYVGRELWRGYFVLEFSWTSKVVLDCPIVGNASFVLPSEWKKMVRESKRSLQSKWGPEITKLVHRGAWLERLRNVLWG